MREDLLEKAALSCPNCRKPGPDGMVNHPVGLGQVIEEDDDFVLKGFVHCSNGACGARYPILEGVPVILKDMKAWWQSEKSRWAAAGGGSPEMKTYFEDLSRPDPLDHTQRGLLGVYMDFHYGPPRQTPPAHIPGSDPDAYWKRLIELARPDGRDPYRRAVDVGCAVGRYTFELAAFSELAVGLDLSFSQVSAAAKIQRTRKVSYEKKRHGTRFERVVLPYAPRENVLFLVGDALDPPCAAASFDFVSALNLVDAVKVPLILLGQMNAMLRPGGKMILNSPYEWRPDVSEMKEWLETESWDAPEMVRRILKGEIYRDMGVNHEIIEELEDTPWLLRNHDRYWSLFLLHTMVSRKKG